jgi:hypothetical protein
VTPRRAPINPERLPAIPDMRSIKTRYEDACARVQIALGQTRTDAATLIELDIAGIKMARLARLMLEEDSG